MLKRLPNVEHEVEDLDLNLNNELADKFYKDNKDLIERLNKRLAYIPKK